MVERAFSFLVIGLKCNLGPLRTPCILMGYGTEASIVYLYCIQSRGKWKSQCQLKSRELPSDYQFVAQSKFSSTTRDQYGSF